MLEILPKRHLLIFKKNDAFTYNPNTNKFRKLSFPDNPFKKTGHRGFLSLIWELYKCNQNARKYNAIFDITVKFPLKWFK